MYLHLVEKTVVPFAMVIGVFDLDNTSSSRNTRAYLERAQKEGRVIDVSGELPRSFVVCAGKNGRDTVYLTQISARTLMRRAEVFEIGEL